jgi:Leucine-rich repeat (LRR) protein
LERTGLQVSWWHSLSPSWKEAFAQTCFKHTNEPTPTELDQVYNAGALRFVGPSAPYPNMSVELEDLSSLAQLDNLEILVVSHHRVESIDSLSSLERLKCLFLYNNMITSLRGIEGLINLRQLYVQHNRITSLLPIAGLINLEELYIHDNLLHSLQGLTEEHAEKLERLFCKPNDGLKHKELMRVETTFGIRCRSL